ncbi:hypothetical protein MXB_5179 [Myxobolus squamalis]|nr:hypothetical protein MXB_5179 [Myxobolus squamalis]
MAKLLKNLNYLKILYIGIATNKILICCKTTLGNLFKYNNNLVEHKEIVFPDMAYIRIVTLQNYKINIDYTFKSCPKALYQLCIMHAVERDQSFTTVF